MPGFETSQARHLAEHRPLKKPMLQAVRDQPMLALPPDQQLMFDRLAFLQERYSRLPRRGALFLRKLVGYRGNNPALRAAASLARAGVSIDLKAAGRGDATPLVTKGLAFAAEIKRMTALAASNGNAVDYSSGVGYDDESHDLAIAQRYKAWHQGSLHFASEEERLGTPFYFAITNTTKFLNANPAIKTFINFGACYGLVDYELAKRNPGVHFFGVDRAHAVKAFNDDNFSAPNLDYVAADISEFLQSRGSLADAAFFFQRTAMIFPEPFLTKLFDLLAELEIRAVIGIEPFGYSVTEGRFFETSETEYRPSIHQRGIQFLHNYPHFCRRAGLRVIEQKWLVNAEPKGDETDSNQSYCFIAAR